MGDPLEGLGPDGRIRTGASIERVPAHFHEILHTAVRDIVAAAPTVSVYAYGSVTTGQARRPDSDVDLLAIGLDAEVAGEVSAELSARFAEVCRGVEIAAASPSDFAGETDAEYGGRVFLHHYCVHLGGPDLDRATTGFPGDRRAARGFNGDIDGHLVAWQREFGRADPSELGRRLARKSLLAVTGLVSVHDATWTTDRRRAAHRWLELHPDLEFALLELLAWADGGDRAEPPALRRQLDRVIPVIVRQFDHDIGLWPPPSA